eukprot:CAMPEP_0172159754 /NCGR_PEP_ID=MMETSP1050-20130122/5158_1 /TAXON_ID=233186 /ORGANISM="Cryptomonas curvata, Strain CCAP979/52" /LENGTH=180 /DNA_ID=CAMNT_0012829401 /DNA_START=32 /DNA_END=574 /DNA_ORIENTATION=-
MACSIFCAAAMPVGVDDALAEGAGGRLNARSVVLGVGELRMTRGLGVVLAEVLHLLKGEVVAGNVQPGVEEHGAVAAGEDEAIPVKPLRVLRVVLENVGVEDGADLSASEGKTKMARMSLGDGIHGKTASLSSRTSERGSVKASRSNRRHTQTLAQTEGSPGLGTSSSNSRGTKAHANER